MRVQPNPTLEARSARITVANPSRTVRLVTTVLQSAATCTYVVTPAAQSFSSAGGRSSFAVDARPGPCEWTAWPSAPWVVIESGSHGIGGGWVYYRVPAITAQDSNNFGRITVSGLSGLNPPAIHKITRGYSPYD